MSYAPKAASMEIRLNGKVREVAEGSTVLQLLRELDLDPQRVAVMVNEDIVRRERHAEATLRPGDTVEVLTIMAGG
jgi:thiamine biosynthesis protein ThiS